MSAPVVAADGNTAVTIVVQLRYSATVPARAVPVSLSVTGATVSLASAGGVTDTNGMFTTTMTASAPGVARITAAVKGQSGSTTFSASVSFVSIAAGMSLDFGPIATVGRAQAATVTAVDSTGQRVLYYEGTVRVTSSDPLATLPPLYQFTDADQGQHVFDGIVFHTVGTQSIVATDTANPNITARVDAIEVYADTPPMLEVTGVVDALAGTLNRVQVRVVDISGHTVTGYTGTVQLTSTDPAADLPGATTYAATDAGIKVLPLTLKTAGIQAVSVVDINNVLISGVQSNIAVLVLADRFGVTLQSHAVAGSPAVARVAAMDAYGNVDPNYFGPVVFTTSDLRGTTPGAYAFTPADAGVHEANVTFYTAGTQSLTAQGASVAFSGEVRTSVAGAPVVTLGLLSAPQAVAGTLVSLVATAYDAYGNVSDGYTGSLTVTSSDSRAQLPGPVSVTPATAGSVVLPNVALVTVGTQTVTVTDANRGLSANASITVHNGPAASLVVSGLSSGAAGLVQQMQVTAYDGFGNVAADYTGHVVTSSDDPQAVLPPVTAFTGLDAGSRVLSGITLKTAGRHVVAVSDNANPNIRGTRPNLLITPLAASTLLVTTPGNAAVGVQQNIVVHAVDIYGNTDPAFVGSVTLSSSDSAAGLPAPYNFQVADAGAATLVATFFTGGSQTVTATAGSFTSAPALIQVVASVTAKLGLSGLTGGRAGRTQNLVVQALDNFNNLVPSYVGSVQLSSSDPNANFTAAVLLSPANGGQTLVPVTLVSAGVQSMTAHDLALPSIAGTQGNILITAVADRLLVQSPAVVTAGGIFTLTVAGADAYNNIDTTYAGTVNLGTTSMSSTLPASLTITAGMHGVINANVALTGAGTQLIISAQDTTQPFTGSRSGIRVLPGAAAALSVQAPATAFVGLPFSALLTAYDAYGNLATGYAGTVGLGSSDPGAALGGNIVFISAGQGSASATGLVWSAISGGATLSATDIGNPNVTGTQSGIVVRPGGAAKLRVTGATSGPSGHTDSVTVTALDNSNNLAVGYTGTLRLTNTDPRATLPVSYTFTTSDAGSHTFAVIWATVGNQSITVQDTGVGALGANQNGIVIVPGAAQALVLTDTSPGAIVAGVTRNLQVAAVDGFGNVDPNYTGTLTFASADLSAVLPGPLTMNANAAGVVRVSYALTSAGTWWVAAQDNGAPALTGNITGLVVSPGPLAGLHVSGIADAPAGIATTATVEAVDAYGNLVTTYVGTVHFTSSDPLAVLSGDVTFRAQDQGSRTLPVTLYTGGQQSVTVTDTQAPSVTGTQSHINVRVSRTRLAVTAPSPVVAGQGFNITVAALDAYGNIDPNYTGTVTLTGSDAQVFFGTASVGGPGSAASLTFGAGNAGQIQLPSVVLYGTTVSAFLSATDGAQALFGQRTGIVVAAGPVVRFFVTAPTTTAAGVPFAAQISAVDVANNIATTYIGHAGLTANDSAATLPSGVTYGAAAAGSQRVGGLVLASAGNRVLTVTDANNITGNVTLAVTALGPTALTVSGATGGVAGHADSVTVTAVDSYGNPANGNVGQVTLTSSDALATLPAPFALGGGNTHTFTGVQWHTAGTQNLTATAAPPAGAPVTGQQNHIVITAAAPAAYGFRGLVDAAAGTQQIVTVSAVDGLGNTNPAGAGTVTLTSSDTNAVMPASVNLLSGQATFGVTLSTAGVQNLGASGSGLSGTSGGVTISAAPANHFVVSGVAGGVTGQGTTATITAYDAYNNMATNYLGAVTVTSSDPLAALPAALSFTNADAGSETVPVTFFTAGTQSVTATDTVSGITGQQNNIVVTGGQRFVLSGPASVGAGQSFSVTVQAVDNSNNIDTGFTGTVYFASNDAHASLPGSVTFSGANAGQQTVSGFSFATSGNQLAILATTLPSGRSGVLYPMMVARGSVSGFTVSAPTSVTAGSSFNLLVSATDNFGNLVPGYTGTAVLTTNDIDATLPGLFTFTGSDAGARTVSATLRTATPTATLIATDTNRTGFAGQQNNIVVLPLTTVSNLTLSVPATMVAGQSHSIIVAAVDLYGNPVPQYRGTVSFTGSDASANLPTAYTFIGADHGTRTFSGVYLATAGNQSIIISDANRTARANVIITPAAASFFALNTNSRVTAGQAQNVTIAATDPYGNTDVNYTGSVTLTTTDPLGMVPGTYSFNGMDAGSHILATTWQSAGTWALTVVGTGGLSGGQSGIVVNPGPTTHLSLSGVTQIGTGVAASVTVRALDAAGNTTPAYGGTVHFVSSDTRATLPTDYIFNTGAGGVHTASVTFVSAGNQNLTATDTAVPGITGTLGNIAVTAPAVALRVLAAGNVTAGSTLPVAVQVVDNFNNIATAYTGTVLVDLSDGQATYATSIAFTNTNNGNVTLSGAFKTTGTQTLRARDSQGLLTAATVSVNVAAAAPDHYDITGPVSVAAGGNVSLTLVARDIYGNATASYGGTALLTSSDPAATLPGHVIFSGGQATAGIARLYTAGSGTTLTATDTNTPAITGTTGGIAVTPLATVSFSVAGATSGAAGHAQSVTVAARDMYNNVTPAYRGTVVLSSTDLAATLPTGYVFGGSDAGTHVFGGVVLVTSGNQTIRANDTPSTGLTGAQAGIAIAPGTAVMLLMAGPGGSAAGAAQTFAVGAVDAYGNFATGFRGAVTLTATDTQASLPLPYSFTAGDAGNHNFSVTLATAGTQTVTAAAAGVSSAQATVTVAPGAMSTLSVSGLATAPAGTSQMATVRAVDNYNNTTPGYRGTVALGSTDTRATLSGNYTYLTGDAGSKTLPVTLLTRGAQRVRATDTLNPNLTGGQNVWVTVAQTQLTVVADTQVVAGAGFNVTVSATDAYANVNPNYAGTVHFTSSDPNAVLPADVVFNANNQGTVTLLHQGFFKTASLSQSLTATDGNNFTGTQSGIAVSAGPPAMLSVAMPPLVTAGSAFTLAATAYDAYGNPATGYTGTVTFGSTDTNALLPPLSNFTLANLGSKTFTNGARLIHAGTQVISVIDANSAISGSGTTVVQASTPATLALTGPLSAVAGAPVTLTVAAYDRYGNIATGMNDTVSMIGSDVAGTYPGPLAFQSTDAGSRTLTGATTLRTAGVVGLTVTDVVNTGVTAGLLYLTVNPGPISSLALTGPSSVTAATSFSCTVSGVDAYMNVVNNYAATVQLASTDPQGLPSSSAMLPVSFSSGSLAQRTVGGLRLLTAGAQSLSASDANGIIVGSTPIQVTAGAPYAVQVATAGNVTAGSARSIMVTAVDGGNNIAASFTGNVTFAVSDANATPPATLNFAASDHGQKTVAAAVRWRTAGTQVLYASASGLLTGNANVNVNPAAVSGLQIYGVGNTLAGGNNQATVRALDAFGNTAPSYTGTVTLSSSDTAATLPGPTQFASGDAGSKAFPLHLYTAGLQSVTVTDAGNSYTATQANIFVGVQRSRFTVTSPNSVVAGVPWTLSVAATDAYNNLDANFIGSLHFTSSDANASFPSGVSIAGADHGQKSIANFTLATASPNATITVLDNTNTVIGTTAAIAVGPAAATRLGVSTISSTPAGTPITATVTAYDAYANVATGYTGTVVVSSGNANTVLPAPASFAANGNGTLSIGSIYLLSATGNTDVTVTDNANSTIAGSRTGIQVTALGADHFVLAGVTSGAAGHVSTLSVLARDMYNNVATSYRGTVGFSSSPPGGAVPGNYQYTGGDQGNHAFVGVSFSTIGTWSVTATDSVTSTITGTQSGIVITGNAASHLTLSSLASATAGQQQNILVSATDAYGNIDAGFTGAVTFTTTDPNATVPTSHSFSSGDAGTWLLPITYATAVTQTLTATGPAAVGSVQTNTVVAPGNANSYVLSGVPNAPAGQATSVTVRVIDAYNNTVPLYRGQTHITSSDPHPVLPNDYIFGSSDNGVKALGITLTTAGTQWVQATDTNNSSITGRQSGIVVGVAQSHLQVVSNTNVVAGVPFSVTVTAVDAFNNLNTGYTGTVQFTSPDANASLPGNTIVSNSNNGSITVSGIILRQATSNQSITVTDTNVSTYTGSQAGIAVTAAAAAGIGLGTPVGATAGVAFSPVVTAYDAFANVAVSYTGSVTFSSSDGGATKPAGFTFNSGNAGAKTLANGAVLVTSGNQTLTVTDAGNGFVATRTVPVSAAATAGLGLVTSGTSTAGNVIVMAVQALDAYGNIAPTYRGAVTFSSGDPNASYPGNYNFVVGDAGQHAFNTGMVLRQSGTNLVSVSDANNLSIGQGTVIISVNSAPLTGFRVSAPAITTSESPFLVTVSGLDAYNNIANTYTGTMRLSSSDPNGVPSSTSPFTFSFVSGGTVQHSWSGVLLNTAGTQTFSAKDVANPNTLNGQANVTVLPLPAGSLSLTGFPLSVSAGQQGNITVRAYDNYGNIASGYGATIHFTSSDVNAQLPGDYSFVPADNGVHTFYGLSLHTASSAASITATDANAVNGTESLIVVGPASPNQLVVTTPATATAGVGFNLTVAAQDVYGNVATGYRGAVSFSSTTNPNALLPSAYAFLAGDNGQHLFAGGATIFLSGNQNITVADTNHTSTATTAVTSNNATSLLWTTVASTVAGTTLTPTLRAYDLYGNLCTVYGGNVTFTSNDPNATLPGSYVFGSGDAGSHTFAGGFKLATSGVRTLTATDTNVAALVTPAQNNITVSPNITTNLWVAMPATVQPALTYSTTITARDAYANVTPAYTGTVTMLSSDGNAVPSSSAPQSVTFASGNAGMVTVNNLRLQTVGSQTLSVHDQSTVSIAGSASTTVAAQNANANYTFTQATSPNFSYNSAQISMARSTAALLPAFTVTQDYTATVMAANSNVNLVKDSNGYMRISNANTLQPYIFYSGLDIADPLLTWTNTVDTTMGGATNVAGFSTGLTGPESNQNSSVYRGGSALGNSVLYSGYANGGGTTSAYTKLWNLQPNNVVLASESYLYYYYFPQGSTGTNSNPGVNGNNSMYAIVDLVFTDGTDLAQAALADANNVTFTPGGFGASNRVALNQWNYVRVNLGSLAGKTVDHISLMWQKNGATGGYRGFIDQVTLMARASTPSWSASTMNPNWTPQWNNMVDYWSFDGSGAIANNQNIVGVKGRILQAGNNDGHGMSFVSGQVGQGVFFDSVDDGLYGQPNYAFPTGSMTYMVWERMLNYQGLNPSCTGWVSLDAGNGNNVSNPPACGQDMTYYNVAGAGYNAHLAEGTTMPYPWSHLAVTVDSNTNTLCMYRDGGDKGCATLGTTWSTSTATLSLNGYSPPLGIVDELAVWNTALNSNEIYAIYTRQASKYSGQQTLPIANTSAYATPYVNMQWSNANALMPVSNANLLLYYTLDESVRGGYVGGDFNDLSGNGYIGTVDPAVIIGEHTPLGLGASNFTSSAYAASPTISGPAPDVFTIAVWFLQRGYATNGAGLMGLDGGCCWDRMLYIGWDGLLRFGVFPNTFRPLTANNVVSDRRWHLGVGSLGPAGQRVYLDGVLNQVDPATTNGDAFSNGQWTIGKVHGLGGWVNAGQTWLTGAIAEARVYTRQLSDAEVQRLYLAGSTRLLMQSRRCTSSTCADNPNWSGPDGTSSSYYSGTGVSGIPPYDPRNPQEITGVNSYTQSTSSTAPYVQYQAVFQSDDYQYQCNYAGAAAPCSPLLAEAKVDSLLYPTSAKVSLVSSATPYYTTQTFAQTLDTSGCTSGVTYTFSPDGQNYYYYNGAAWVSSNNSVAQTTSASLLTSAAITAYSNLTGGPHGGAVPPATYFNAFLASDGNQPCALQSVNMAISQ